MIGMITSSLGGRLSLKICFHQQSRFSLHSLFLSGLTSSHDFVTITFKLFVSFLSVLSYIQAAVPAFSSNQLFLPTPTTRNELHAFPSSQVPHLSHLPPLYPSPSATPSLANFWQDHILSPPVCVPASALPT